MPISFLDQQQTSNNRSAGGQLQSDSRLKARQFVREFASHRFGVFKESGFRSDFMYPPFSSVAGLGPADGQQPPMGGPQRWPRAPQNATAAGDQLEPGLQQQQLTGLGDQQQEESSALRGFDEHFRECKFDTSPASGLPANAQAANCLPYLVRADKSIGSFNLMSADPFAYAPPPTTAAAAGTPPSAANELPVQWAELAEHTKWHFCGENFANPNYLPAPAAADQAAAAGGGSSSAPALGAVNSHKLVHYEHNQRAANKQNKMCHDRSALEVIRWSDDFRSHQQFR
jgi:hypothetical protein